MFHIHRLTHNGQHITTIECYEETIPDIYTYNFVMEQQKQFTTQLVIIVIVID